LRPIVLVLVLLALSGGRAAALELVVAEAHGIRLVPGQAVDAAKPLTLLDGQSVTLLSSSGQIVQLEGPSDAAPESGLKHAESGDVQTAMTALITERQARTSEVGVVRGEGDVKLPDPWVVDVTHPGTSCVQPNQPVVLWRSEDMSQTPIAFAPKDRSWTVSGTWPAATDRLSLPATMPLRDHTDYVIEFGDKVAPVTVRLIPAAVNNDAMRAGYMTAVGCGNQLNALLAKWQK
jgi:hypothetical protein